MRRRRLLPLPLAAVSLGEWLVMRSRFNYLTIEVEN